ncbi:transposase family protein [Streptomyces anulatus]|uniref:helix-turn-helix domain-containing protein n=1 Tax=Streptomyces anulatus TaxID=1892 RepID=UPI002B1CC93E|nr:transposase family protein [Streptomyces anulatus]
MDDPAESLARYLTAALGWLRNAAVGNKFRAAIISDRRITGLPADVIAELVAEIGPLCHKRHQARLESRPWKRAVGTGAKHQSFFIDRLLATLVHLRHGAAHDLLACWFGVDRSMIIRDVGEVRPLLAQRGCTAAPGVRLRTLAEVIEHLGSSGQTGIVDGTEIRSAGLPSAARIGGISPPARTSRTPSRQWPSPAPAAGSCSGAQPSRPVPTSPTPGSWAWSST